MSTQTEVDVHALACRLTKNPYGVGANNAHIDSENGSAVFCFETSFSRTRGIQELSREGVPSKSVGTMKLGDAYSFPFLAIVSKY